MNSPNYKIPSRSYELSIFDESCIDVDTTDVFDRNCLSDQNFHMQLDLKEPKSAFTWEEKLQDSNPGPLAYRANTLTTELPSHIVDL